MPHKSTNKPPALRIAIVGGGPKAIYALESLVAGALTGLVPDPSKKQVTQGVDGFVDSSPELAKPSEPGKPGPPRPRATQRRPRPIKVTIFEPQEIGEGMAFTRELPLYMRLNVDTSIIDPWTSDVWEKPWDFDRWRMEEGVAKLRKEVDEDEWEKFAPLVRSDYASRTLVGRYLGWVFDQIVRQAPSFVSIKHEQKMVEDAAMLHGRFDQVLIATGHAPDIAGVPASDSALGMGWEASVPLVSGAYPPSRLDAIEPGARVGIRGAALTMIDVVLALTEGRGGEFVETLQEPPMMQYAPSGREPAVILPSSLTKQFMWPKPASEVSDDERQIIDAAIKRLHELPEPTPIEPALDIIRDCAHQIMLQEGWEDAAAREALDKWQETGWDQNPHTQFGVLEEPYEAPESDLTLPDSKAREYLRSAIFQVRGLAKRGPAWASARAWAGMYSALVERLSLLNPGEEEWSKWLDAAGQYEALAFGPPLINARKLVALMDCGLMSPEWMDLGVAVNQQGAFTDPDDPDTEVTDQVEVIVDAVLAPAGVVGSRNPATDSVLDSGEASTNPGQRGFAITADARCIRKDGSVSSWLSAIGRPTEDSLVSNDTLNRAIHPQPQLWARRMLQLSGR